MKIKIYQIDLDKDENGVAFESYEKHAEATGMIGIDSHIYNMVFDGEVNCTDLEDVYRMFNIDIPEGYDGRSLSVSDIVGVTDQDGLERFYYCDNIGFQAVDFDSELANITTPKIEVLVIRPMEKPKAEKVSFNLKAFQEIVEGDIEIVYPFKDDNACIVCNGEGKINGLQPNRGLTDDKGNIVDILFGTFFICAYPAHGESDELYGLTETQLEKYNDMFALPEKFYTKNGTIYSEKCTPRTK